MQGCGTGLGHLLTKSSSIFFSISHLSGSATFFVSTNACNCALVYGPLLVYMIVYWAAAANYAIYEVYCWLFIYYNASTFGCWFGFWGLTEVWFCCYYFAFCWAS